MFGFVWCLKKGWGCGGDYVKKVVVNLYIWFIRANYLSHTHENLVQQWNEWRQNEKSKGSLMPFSQLTISSGFSFVLILKVGTIEKKMHNVLFEQRKISGMHAPIPSQFISTIHPLCTYVDYVSMYRQSRGIAKNKPEISELSFTMYILLW